MSDNESTPTIGLEKGDVVGIVVSRFNREVTDGLLQGARAKLSALGVSDAQIEVVFVPGAWEIPLALQQMSRSNRYAALIALGAVIRGQTTHDRHINRFVSLSIGKLSLEYGIPIVFGVLTCKTTKQALRRADPQEMDKGGEVAATAVEMVHVLRSISPATSSTSR